jgi:hypothetical protein
VGTGGEAAVPSAADAGPATAHKNGATQSIDTRNWIDFMISSRSDDLAKSCDLRNADNALARSEARL